MWRLLLLFLVVVPHVVRGRDIYVATDGHDDENGTLDYPVKSVLSAVELANPGELNTIKLFNGTYLLTTLVQIVDLEILLTTESGNQDVKIQVQDGLDPGFLLSESLVTFRNLQLSGGKNRCITATNTSTVMIEGCEVKIFANGVTLESSTLVAHGSVFSNIQGAVYSKQSEVEIRNCTFSDNTAGTGTGGAIEATSSNLTSTGNLFHTNTASSSGGALDLRMSSTLTSTNDVFVSNKAPTGGAIRLIQSRAVVINAIFDSNTCESPSGTGGGIFSSSSTLQVTSSNFTTNFAQYGAGAIVSTDGHLSSSSNLYLHNGAGEAGGAIYNYQGEFYSTSDQFIGNNASTGGALYDSGTITSMSMSKFIQNSAAENGGAIYSTNQGASTFSKVTISLGTATNGSGLYVASGTPSFFDCSITGNNATEYGGGAILAHGNSSFVSSLFEENCAGINGSAFFVQDGFQTCYDCAIERNCPEVGVAYIDGGNLTFIDPTTTTHTTHSTTSQAPSTAPPTTPTTTSTLKTTTPDTTSTTTTTPQNELVILQNCTEDCPSLTINIPTTSQPNNEVNTTWVIEGDSTLVQLTASTPDSTIEFETGWGDIREVTSTGQIVKSLNPVNDNWPRIIQQNTTTVIITYTADLLQSTTSKSNDHRRDQQEQQQQERSLRITLTTFIDLRQNITNTNTAAAAAKFSLSIDGDWQFTQPSNTLDVDYTVRASFRMLTSCGKQKQYTLSTHTDENVYQFGAASTSGVELAIVNHCTADDAPRLVHTLDPVFFDNNTAVNVTIRFPSFTSSLYYDPNFGLLLGFTGDWSCDPLLAWILPAAFLGAAAVIVVGAIFLTPRPKLQRTPSRGLSEHPAVCQPTKPSFFSRTRRATQTHQ